MSAGESRTDPPELSQAAKELGQAGLELGRTAWGALGGFRRLAAADFALSRSALGMTLAYSGVAIALGASSWLLLMILLVLALQAMGLSLIAAVALPALLSCAGAAFAAWRAMQVFDDTRLNATRRQLARIGMGEDPTAVERDPERVA